MKLIDTHSHLHGSEFTEDRNTVFDRAAEVGVGKICLIGVDEEDCRHAVSLANSRSNQLIAVVGVHPNESSKWSQDSPLFISELIKENPEVVVGIGETGLDYHYDFVSRDKQREAFVGHIELARRHSLPLVIHCREAYEDVLQILENEFPKLESDGDRIRGVMHCWFGSMDHAERTLDLGFVLGIGGASTFKNAKELHEVIKKVPTNRLVLETDAPYMAPVPYRGKRNESQYIPIIAERIAELKNISAVEVAEITTATALKLYNLKNI